MPNKKRGKKSNNDSSTSRPIPIHQDSLRRDIEVAQGQNKELISNGGMEGVDEAEEGLDIADQLLASLEARDKAADRLKKASLDEERANRGHHHFHHHHHNNNAHKVEHSTSAPPTEFVNHSSSSTSPLKNAGEKLLHVGEKIFGQSPPDHHERATTVIPTDHVDQELSSDMQRKGSIRKLFGGKRSPQLKTADNGESGENLGKKKISRQKARMERKAAEMEAQRIQAQEELKANGGKPDEAERERLAIQDLCKALNVELKEINPDGHCLYAAVADQLNLLSKLPGQEIKYIDTRKATADYMRNHSNDFLPFISDSDEQMAGIVNKEAGSKLSNLSLQEKYFLGYCDAVEKTGIWGGQPEILALSKVYKTPIHIVQAGSEIVKIGQEDEKSDIEPLMLSYHRHSYGLGEHYNSLHKKKLI